jgi:glycerol uptake facilitator-like aquaporin
MEIARLVTMRPTAADVRAAGVEFVLTTAFMATVFSLVHRGIGTASANELRLRVAAVSILVGLIIVGFATSAPGRFSGAHMNPAITLGVFAAGRLPARRVLPYVAAQIAGSVAAAALVRVVWGPAVSEGPVRWAVVQPGTGWTGASVAAAEAVTLLVIVGVMCWMTARRPKWRAAWVVGGLFGLQGALLGTTTGGSANPARQLGPALFSGEYRLLAVYLVAPAVGGVFAGWAAHRLQHAGNLRRHVTAAAGLSSISATPTRNRAGRHRCCAGMPLHRPRGASPAARCSFCRVGERAHRPGVSVS